VRINPGQTMIEWALMLAPKHATREQVMARLPRTAKTHWDQDAAYLTCVMPDFAPFSQVRYHFVGEGLYAARLRIAWQCDFPPFARLCGEIQACLPSLAWHELRRPFRIEDTRERLEGRGTERAMAATPIQAALEGHGRLLGKALAFKRDGAQRYGFELSWLPDPASEPDVLRIPDDGRLHHFDLQVPRPPRPGPLDRGGPHADAFVMVADPEPDRPPRALIISLHDRMLVVRPDGVVTRELRFDAFAPMQALRADLGARGMPPRLRPLGRIDARRTLWIAAGYRDGHEAEVVFVDPLADDPFLVVHRTSDETIPGNLPKRLSRGTVLDALRIAGKHFVGHHFGDDLVEHEGAWLIRASTGVAQAAPNSAIGATSPPSFAVGQLHHVSELGQATNELESDRLVRVTADADAIVWSFPEPDRRLMLPIPDGGAQAIVDARRAGAARHAPSGLSLALAVVDEQTLRVGWSMTPRR
jgi:hypothetical protein